MNFDNYLFRPHAVVNIMGGVPKPLTANQEKTLNELKIRHEGDGKPLTLNQVKTLGGLLERKDAKCTLTDAAKKYLEKLVFEELTKRSSKIQAKYLDKGLVQEDKSITTYSNVLDKLLLKNKERRTNKYFSGECDNSQGKIRDIKSSWSYETFPLMDTKINNKGYIWQLDCYMDLWDLKESELVYVLVDTPNKLVNDEIKRLDWKHNVLDQEGNVRNEQSKELIVETVCNHIFTLKGLESFCENNSFVELEWFEGVFIEIPEEMRVKVFQHNYCEIRNRQLKEMIDLARDYMNEVLLSIPENQKKLIELKSTKSVA
ncbi:hypothetical protein [Tenacibaculum caenipelagi]|uniref:Uncharacterized protein n=1 Tax=Tenacibaculum caenipelagi TaxID=1325435 RepID=A0A4R6TG68_9FLAO|nr:hypothetical protein [Tenacibaculum caenipelagi]TDQ27679.1 hypothetical protein DFQ07_1530 [Tenacibaculum caenipelagi]